MDNDLFESGTVGLVDYEGRTVRLTSERRTHILAHPEMAGQLERIAEALAQPELIIATSADESVHVYHRFYGATPVTRSHLKNPSSVILKERSD